MGSESGYWFPAKRYGWGWGYPSSWQGWVTLIVWAVLFFAGMSHLGRGRPVADAVFAGLMALALLIICYWKGEPPRWRWGE